MADKTTGGPAKGQTHGGDQTSLPGQAAGKIPFGVKNPLQTGAPGSGGTGPSPDPTLQAPVPESSYGAHNDDSSTGAPGTSGTSADVATGATYTKMYDGAYPMDSATGGSVDTE